MKKILIIVLTIFVALMVGELCTSQKSIIRQQNNMNVWRVNHFFDLFHTKYLGPINDTTRVTITDKNKTAGSYVVHVSDGNKVTVLKSHDIYKRCEIGDTINLITTFEPTSKHSYKTKYTIY